MKKLWDVDNKGYGPGDEYKINTQKPFTVKTEFKEEDDKLSAIVQTFTQGSSTLQMTITEDDCAKGHFLLQRADLERGNTLVVSNWGSSYDQMSWLDKETGCQGVCDNSPEVMIDNIKITTVRKPDPHYPIPSPYPQESSEKPTFIQ